MVTFYKRYSLFNGSIPSNNNKLFTIIFLITH